MDPEEFEERVRALVREEMERVPFEKVAVPDRGLGGEETDG